MFKPKVKHTHDARWLLRLGQGWSQYIGNLTPMVPNIAKQIKLLYKCMETLKLFQPTAFVKDHCTYVHLFPRFWFPKMCSHVPRC